MTVCWDLDNTLVDSGTLLREGMSLAEAVAAAAPMASMLEFFVAVTHSIPQAEHVVLSARGGSLRIATTEWLARHGLQIADDRIWLVPDARSKLAVWQSLARRTRLVIVDDLSYGHEGDVRAPYEDLVEAVSRFAVHVGLSDIEAIRAGAVAAKRLAEQLVSRVDEPLGRSATARPTPAGVA